MSQGTSLKFLLARHRGLLLFIGTWMLQGATALAPILRSESTSVELLSSSGFIQVDEAPAKEASSTTSEVWPDAATAKYAENLGVLKGGTHPLKVRIGSDVFVRKRSYFRENSQGIMIEALANDLYRAAQVKSAQCRYYPASVSEQSKKPQAAYILCRFIDGLDPVVPNFMQDQLFTDAVKTAASEHFVLDAVLGNYDVGCDVSSNVGWDSEKNLVRIDNGGALAADVMGAWKPTEYKCKDRIQNRESTWSPEPFQLWDFQRLSPNPKSIYRHLSKEDILSQVKGVMAREKDILAAVDTFQQGVAAEKVKATLRVRLECLGRIAKDRADLFDIKHLFTDGFEKELPSAICNGVRTLCADLLKQSSSNETSGTV